MSNYTFNKNTYCSPIKNTSLLIDKLFFKKNSIPFYLKFLPIIIKARSKAQKGIYKTEQWVESSHEIFKMIEDFDGKFNINGFDNIRNIKHSVVFISNHMSTLETMILPGLISPFIESTFVVKDSLVKNNFFGPVMRSRDPIVVSRSNSIADFKTVMDKGVAKLKEGSSIVIFPQSTRTINFNPEKFNTLGVKLAKKANVDAIPIAIKTDYWGNGKYIKDVGKISRDKTIYFEFGKAMKITNGRTEHKEIIKFISERLVKWNNS